MDYPQTIGEALNSTQCGPDRRSVPPRDTQTEMFQLWDLFCRLGVTTDITAALRIVHIAGTGGKSSTGAYLESLLRAKGLRTGFFCSPHLVEVRERIRLDGQPLTREQFVHHFWQYHDALIEAHVQEYPKYHRLLTFMALRVFLKEKVDVAIFEVGIGGRYDSTNFFANPWLCGFTSLGNINRQAVWEKAGIMKPGSVAVSAHIQPEESLSVLTAEAAAVGCRLFTAPDLSKFEGHERLGLESYQRVNAALALQLARRWLDRFNNLEAPVAVAGQLPAFPLSEEFVEAIRTTRLPGRNTVIRRGPVTFYIDGAHTVESCEMAADWFRVNATALTKMLVFHQSGTRNPSELLTPLTQHVAFDAGLFCPSVVDSAVEHPDTKDLRLSDESADAAVRRSAAEFKFLARAARVVRQGSVSEVVDWIEQQADGQAVDVLVTGSFYLVGCTLAVLQPGIVDGN